MVMYGYVALNNYIGCKSNYKVRNKVRDHARSIPPFHTPVPYPRSIPPFHTPVPYLFEGSVLYLCSIPLFHTSDLYVINLYIYNIYIYSILQLYT